MSFRPAHGFLHEHHPMPSRSPCACGGATILAGLSAPSQLHFDPLGGMGKRIADLDRVVEKIESGRCIVYLDGEPYGLRHIYETAEIRVDGDMAVFGEDDCGNHIAVSEKSGEILFIDHETNDFIVLAESMGALAKSLTVLRDADKLKPKVVESWIDPELLRELKEAGPE